MASGGSLATEALTLGIFSGHKVLKKMNTALWERKSSDDL